MELASPPVRETVRSRRAVLSVIRQVVLGGGALYLFVGALQLMKTGAVHADLLQPGGALVANAATTLGLGWLGALLVLSGSPIAASALSLVAGAEAAADGAHRFTELQGFTMLTGSRLGAAFVVLVIAVIYAIRGGKGNRRTPLSIALTALVTTAVVYVPAAFLGAALLQWPRFQAIELTFPSGFADTLDLSYGWLLSRADAAPGALVFLGGLVTLLVAFKIIDGLLPTLDGDSIMGRRRGLLMRKWPMFLIGCAVALVTMSVSVALSVLVPLAAKGHVSRKHVVPYIMGANITTLGDTMFAAFALNSPGAVRVVLANIIAATIVTVILLTLLFPRVDAMIAQTQRMFVTSPARLVAFTALLFALPASIIALSAAA